MIVRMWHGETEAEKAEAYFAYLQETGVPDYRRTEGNRGVTVLRRMEGERAHFLLLSFWESTEAIEAFAGVDIQRARYYPEDEDYLLALEPEVTHYELLGEFDPLPDTPR